MAISKTYNPLEVETKWYNYWIQKGFFNSVPNKDKEPYTVVIPPPNVTGVLHMGHMLNNTVQDILVRRARMLGKEACWVPGTDHASIATEAKVVSMLKDRGISKKDITRDEFLHYAWEWKEKYGDIILEQLKKLGASCDWNRTSFTMDPSLSKAVTHVFVDLYNKGLIYRGARMVNWDPAGLTAVSDEEVNYKEVDSQLIYINYQIQDSREVITVATTRPETIFVDAAVCINPNDERYKHLKGKKAQIPFTTKWIPIIEDIYVDKEFGTGCLKVTPAHDINDYNLGLKHNLEVLDIFNENGTLNQLGAEYAGLDRFIARKKIVTDLKEHGYILKIEQIKNKVGVSERTEAIIEPRISTQWFCRMERLAIPALENVINDNIKLHPPKFKNTYKHWLENIKDWCISRQLWWGHRIPAYYLEDGSFIVAENEADALSAAKLKSGNLNLNIKDLRQDEDVLDTWFSSWLWPISVFDGFNKIGSEDIKYYYPTNDLVTAPEILFFWVARMVMAGYEYTGKMPFKNVYLTGIVRDKTGKKMSKSLGNSPDPINLIEKYGADGVRTGMLFSSPAGNDLLFDEKLCEQGRNFSNKIWNAHRLIKSWELINIEPDDKSNIAIEWINEKFNFVLKDLEEDFEKFRISEGLNLIYKFVWDDFCSIYLELIKPEYSQPLSQKVYDNTIEIFEKVLQTLHPFVPFITEEIWHEIKLREEMDCIIISPYPVSSQINSNYIREFEQAFQVVSEIRNIRNAKQIPLKEGLSLKIKSGNRTFYQKFNTVIQKLANVSDINFVSDKPENSLSFLIKSDELFILSGGVVDFEKEREAQIKELEYLKGFLDSVLKKLSNERFVQNAKPEVLKNEFNKKVDAEAKIKAIEDNLLIK